MQVIKKSIVFSDFLNISGCLVKEKLMSTKSILRCSHWKIQRYVAAPCRKTVKVGFAGCRHYLAGYSRLLLP